MNAKVLRVLEYDKVIHMLEQKATSDPGRQLCRDLVPMTDLAQIEQAQTETADALTRIFQKGSLNFGSNKPLGMCLRSLEIGSTLSSEELLRIAGLLENTARVKNFGRSDKDEEQQDSLTEYFHCLEPLAPLSKEIRRCIIDVDEIADDASPALKKIRRSMVLTGEKIHNQLNSMVNGSVRNYLQDAVITTRDGRYCIPVKAEYKGQVPGMVHDQSSTGSTHCISWTKYHWITKLISDLQPIFYAVSNLASSHLDSKFVHCLLKLDTVFSTFNTIYLYTNYFDIILI